jgi:hypothetical protein
MSDQQPHPDNWQWDDAAWSQTPAAPTSPEQVPESEGDAGSR